MRLENFQKVREVLDDQLSVLKIECRKYQEELVMIKYVLVERDWEKEILERELILCKNVINVL